MKKVWTLAVLTAALGCSSGPSAIEPPSIDADAAGAKAMELYDKDSNGSIADAELDAAPGLKASMETVDSDHDGKLTAQEIAARIKVWQEGRVGLATFTATVTLDGRPLEGATVTFEPESFLSDELKSAVGQTNGMGKASVTIPKENRVPEDAPPGVQIGIYRVKVSKQTNGSESIPAKYNSETTLGQQIAADDPAMAGQRIRFELKSN